MIDWDRVHQLREEIGVEEFDEVVMMFLDEADEVLARIVPVPSAARLRDDCHFLKGAALNLGFKCLATLCQAAERRAKDGDCSLDLDEMQRCYRSSRDLLLSGIKELAA